MIQYTKRLDNALRISAWAHEKQHQHRKGTSIPYIIHPVGTLLIAGTATDNEDVLIACLMHDILEDVDAEVYDEASMREDFGDEVVDIVLDVTKDESQPDWVSQSHAYLEHLDQHASDEAVIVSASDKIHNLQSVLIDFDEVGSELWERFATKSAKDQLWWYRSILGVITKRGAPAVLVNRLGDLVIRLEEKLVA